MLVAFYNEYSNFNIDDFNFIDILEIDFLPTEKSIVEINNTYYKIEACELVNFISLNSDIVCCWVKEIFPTSSNGCVNTNLEQKFNILSRKIKIKNILK